MAKKGKLELTWVGKDERVKLEPMWMGKSDAEINTVIRRINNLLQQKMS